MQQGNGFWSTEGMTADHAIAYWREAICEAMMELDIEAPRETCFTGWLRGCSLGSTRLSFTHASHHTLRRTQFVIAKGKDNASFDLVQIRSGSAKIFQYGRHVEIGPGEAVLMDRSEVYSFTTSDDCHGLSVHMPRAWLQTHIATPEDGVAQPFTPRTPWGGVLCHALTAVSPEEVDNLPVSPETFASQLATLLALAIGQTASPVTSHARKLLLRIRQSIFDRAHEIDLDPACIAAEYRISRRYVHALFARAGTTFTEELMTARLERAAAMLHDPRFHKLSVAEIGWRCGFAAASHFARRFRALHGTSPGVFRTKLATMS